MTTNYRFSLSNNNNILKLPTSLGIERITNMSFNNETLVEDQEKESTNNLWINHMAPPEVENFYWFNKRRKLFIDFNVDEALMEYERFILKWNMEDKGKKQEDREPIWIYLMNYGGDADLMFSMVDVISLSKTPVYTVNLGQCCSAAALIFLAGHKRFMLPGASMLLHQGSGEIQGDAGKVLDQAEAYKVILKRMNDFIRERTKINPRLLQKKKSNDWTIDAKFCIENGVCDRIVDSIDELV